MTTPTPGNAGDQQHHDSSGSDPTREIEVERPPEEQPSTHPRVLGSHEPQDAPSDTGPSESHPAAPAPWGDAADVRRDQPERPSGPHLPPILLGIVCLAVAGLAIWQEVTDVQVDWGDVGPLGIVAIGALLVLLGVVGLLGSRRRGASRP